MVFTQTADDGYWQVWRSNLDGSGKKQLTQTKIDKNSCSISPDGKKVIYTTNEGELYFINSDGTDEQKLPLAVEAEEPSFSWKGDKILFTSYYNVFEESSDILIVDTDGRNLKKIIRRPYQQFSPSWSPDGSKIIFIDAPELTGHEIMELNLKNDDYIQLTRNHFYEAHPVYTRDGQKIIYTSDISGNYDIWSMGKYGQKQKNLTKNPSIDVKPQVSKDNKAIYFLSNRSGSFQIWKMNINGARQVQITKGDKDIRDFSVW